MPSLHFDIRHYAALGSTNDEARRLVYEDAPHGTVITADEQTAGRGRHARHWFSPPGNVYLTALLRLTIPTSRAAELGFIAALAVADAVDTLLPRPKRTALKWPNDVLVGGAKIAGILVEQVAEASLVGIGLNILHAPTGPSYPVTTLARCGGVTTASGARDILLQRLSSRLEDWQQCGFAMIRQEWLLRAHPIGSELRITRDTGAIFGRFAGLDVDGALLLDNAEGRQRIVVGEVAAAA